MAFSTKRYIQIGCFLTLVFTLVIILAGEIFVRVLGQEDSQEYSNKTLIDETFGWYPKSEFTLPTNSTDIEGNSKAIMYTTDQYGFRLWGDPHSTRKKIFVIGDSYTQAVEVAAEDTYYGVLSDSLDCEVFGFGQAGYGTVQQYLVLDKYLELIQPDLVLLQTCDNDFIDNNYELEKTSNYKVGLARPYMKKNGVIEFRKPVSDFRRIAEKSRFIELLLRKFKYGVTNRIKEPAEAKIASMGQEFKPYERSLELTKITLQKFKKRLNNTPCIIFSASTFEPQSSDFRSIAEECEIPYYDEPAKYVNSLKDSIIVTSHDGYHWVEQGHAEVAKKLIPVVGPYVQNEIN